MLATRQRHDAQTSPLKRCDLQWLLENLLIDDALSSRSTHTDMQGPGSHL